VWDTSTGLVVSMLWGHSSDVWGVALSKHGDVVASCSGDGTTKIWDAHTGECVRSFRSDRLYHRLDITGLSGVTDAQRAGLFCTWGDREANLASGSLSDAIETPPRSLERVSGWSQ
jgi:WD40 repeat protein